MTIIKKIKWVLGILLVFFLIFATNLIDRENFRRISSSVTTIYEDRLVAKDLVFELSLLIQEKEIASISDDYQFFVERNKENNKEIERLIARYLETKLTETEARIFEDLQTNLEALKRKENSLSNGKEDNPDLLSKEINEVNKNLYELSKIQLEEGRRQVAISKRALATVEQFTQLEIYFLVILAVLVQIIVIYKPK
jgi:hypothetical protein